MAQKDLLHQLIKSLTKSEKRTFKLIAKSQGNNKNYIDLFNAIEKQENYNEEAIREEFKGRPFLNQIAVAKNYLQNLILRSLRTHHHNSKVSFQLNNYLSEIELLYWKGLYKLSFKKLKQAKKLASKYDMTLYLLQLHYWESRLEEYVKEASNTEQLIEESKKYLEEIILHMKFEMLIKKMRKITNSSIYGTKEIREVVNEIFNYEELKNPEKITNYHTLVSYLILKGVGNAIIGDKKMELYYKNKALEYIEQNKHQIDENPVKYTSILNNLLLYYYHHGDAENFKHLLQKLNKIDLKFPHLKHTIEHNRFNFNLMYHLKNDDLASALDVVHELVEWYDKQKEKMTRQNRMILEYNVALIYFINKNYKKSLFWVNSMFTYFDFKTKKFRHDLATSSYIINTLIYIDLGHLSLAEKNIKEAKEVAFINKYDHKEMSILKKVRSLIHANTSEFSSKLLELNEQINDPDWVNFNIDRDALIHWIKDKIN